jgi:hypothetical protein
MNLFSKLVVIGMTISAAVLAYFICNKIVKSDNDEVNTNLDSESTETLPQPLQELSTRTEQSQTLPQQKPTTYKVEVDIGDNYVYELKLLNDRLNDKDFQLKAETLRVAGYNTDAYSFNNMNLIQDTEKNKLILTAQQPTRGDFTKIRFLMYLVRAVIDENYKTITGTYTGWYGFSQMSLSIGKS